MTTWNLASALWNGANRARFAPRNSPKLSDLVVGTRQSLEHDRACERCGYHVCAASCAPAEFGVELAEQWLLQDPENNSVVMTEGPIPGRLYFATHEKQFVFLQTICKRIVTLSAKFPWVGYSEAKSYRFRKGTPEDAKNSK